MTREQIERASVTMKESQNYHMSFEDAQDYISKCGFDIPWNDGDVFVDEREITRTVGNVLKWRINSVWHDREEQPEVGRWFIFKADDTNPFKKPTIKKIAYYTNHIENDKGLDWLKMVAEYKILCWAYVDDLLETE